MKRATRAVFIFMFLVASASWCGQRTEAQPANPPYLYCGEQGIECSFTIWDGGGQTNRSFIGVNKQYLPANFVGREFCMQAGAPHINPPLWPDCRGKNGFRRSYGTIKQGKNP
jgi:hypothetical protein